MIICQEKILIRPLTVKVLIFPNFPSADERARSTPCWDILGTVLIIPKEKGNVFHILGFLMFCLDEEELCVKHIHYVFFSVKIIHPSSHLGVGDALLG